MHFAPKGKQRELLEMSLPPLEEKAAEAEGAQDLSKSNSVHPRQGMRQILL